MADIESRLRDFRVRGLGALPIVQLGNGRYRRPRPARALDEADRNMYTLKRSRAAEMV
jgi:hypothetical protein